MNPFYQKIGMSLDGINLPEIKTDMVVGQYVRKTGIGLRYYNVKEQYWTSLRDKLPTDLQTDVRIFYAEFRAPGSIVPHRDHGVISGLNYYFQPSDGITTWYNLKHPTEPYKYGNEQTSNLYKDEDVELVDQFVAQQNECYLLNIDKIHNITVPNMVDRLFVCWLWPTTRFEDVRASFEREGRLL